jgi:ribonuclease P protein subunit POP4
MASSTHIAHNLLLNAHPPDLASTIFTDKVLHKPLHLRPTSPNPTSQDARAHRRLERLRKTAKSQQKKPKPLSAKQKRISGIYDIPKDAQKYEIYARLHQMWVSYMWEILGIKEGGGMAYVTAQGTGGVLVSADYHGAEVMVVRSRCSGLVGLAGIVVRDTKFTFQVITKNDVLKSEWVCVRDWVMVLTLN